MKGNKCCNSDFFFNVLRKSISRRKPEWKQYLLKSGTSASPNWKHLLLKGIASGFVSPDETLTSVLTGHQPGEQNF